MKCFGDKRDRYVIKRDEKFASYQKTGFDNSNNNACLKFVLVGITPGSNQTPEEAEKEAKEHGFVFNSIEYKFWKAFNGKQMRTNLAKMFKYINSNVHEGMLNDLLNTNIDDLFVFEKDHSIIDFTSLLKNATYKYSKKKDEYVFFNAPSEICEKNPELLDDFNNGFLKDFEEVYSKCDVVYIACGRQVYNFLYKHLVRERNIPKEKLIAIVHPSPAAQGYVNSFCKGGYNPERLY